MNNGIDAEIRPDTEERVAAAMRSLAATHIPESQPAVSGGAVPRRWMLAVAASTVLIAGVAALLVASNRDTDSAADRLPQPETTTVTSDPNASVTVLPAVPFLTFSETPLGDDMVPVIVPPPAEPVRGFELGATDWTIGIENGTTFAVMESDRVVGSIQMFDSPAPWDVIAVGQSVTQLSDHDVIRVDGSDERGFFVRIGDGTRAALDTSPPAHALSIDSDIAALVSQVGDGPLDRFENTERFVRVPIESTRGRSISYGSDGTVQLLQVRLETGASGNDIDLVEEAYGLFTDQSGTFQMSTVVQVSPLDLVVIVARNEEDLATARNNLQLVPLDASGVDFTTYGGFTGDDLWARGEPAWGRWQVTFESDGDASCQFFQVNVWNIDGVSRGYTDCGEGNPVRADGSRVYCTVLEVEIVGAVVGATAEAQVAVGDDIDGLRAETEETSTDLGQSTTFRIVQTEPGANIRAATVLVDGVEIDCTG